MLDEIVTPFYEIDEIVLTHKNEVEGYLHFVEFTSNALSIKNSSLNDGDGETFKVTTDLINTLYSNSYLLFYNSIESVVTKIVDFLSKKISAESKKISDFRTEIQKHWIRDLLDLNNHNMKPDSRLSRALEIINHFSNDNPLEIKIKKGGANFDDKIIYKLLVDIGSPIDLSEDLSKKLNQGYGGISCLEHIRDKRNHLSHGRINFNECGKDITIQKLHAMSEIVFGYLEELEKHFRDYIDKNKYLLDLK